MGNGHWWSIRYGVTLVLLLSTLASASGAEKAFTRIGILQMTPVLDASVEAFKRRMAQLGYCEGETVQYIYTNAHGSPARLDEHAQALVAMPVDLLLTVTTAATTAAQAATLLHKIPVVFTAVMFPKEAGLVERIEQPGGWITGTSPLVLASKQLEIFAQAVPHLQTLGIVYTAGDHVEAIAQVLQAARARQLTVASAPVWRPEEVVPAVAGLVKRIDALYIPPDNVVTTQIAAIIQTALHSKIPVMVPTESGVQQGALLSYSADYQELARFAADMVHKILRGEKPGGIPVEYPVKPKLTLNLTTSRAIGLSIPRTLLFLADEVIGSLAEQ